MKNKFLILLNFCLYSCVTTSASHQHYYLSESNSPVNLKIFCSTNDKLFLIEANTYELDTIYIKSNFFNDPKRYYLMQDSNGFDNSSRVYKARINDNRFHKLILTYPIEIKIKRLGNFDTFNYTVKMDNR